MKSHILILLLALAGVSLAADRRLPDETGVVLLPPFSVREPGMTDFGMSIVTNPEVASGGKVAWMLVGNVIKRSAASLAGLRPGDKIHQIDSIPVAKLSKLDMLTTFFGREPGARLRLDVVDPLTLKHRVVALECNLVRIDKKSNQTP